MLIFLLSGVLPAQTKVADSLKIVSLKESGQKKVDLLNSIGKQLYEYYYDSAIHYSGEALNLAQNLKYVSGEAEANRIIGLAEIFNNKRDPRPFLYRSLALFDSLGDKKGMASTNNNLGLMYNRIRNDSSLVYFNKAVSLFRELGDKPGEAAALNYIGIAYQYKGQFQNAVEYALKGLEVRKTTNDFRGIVYSMINVGNMFLEAGQYNAALDYYLESISFADTHHLLAADVAYHLAYNRIGETYLRMGQYKEAEKYLKKSIPVDNVLMGKVYLKTNRPDSAILKFSTVVSGAEMPGNTFTKASAFTGLSKAYLLKGNLGQSIKFGREAFRLADSIQHMQLMSESAEILANALEQNGDFRQSINYLKTAHQIQDSIKDGVLQNKLASFEYRARLDSEQTRVKILSAEKKLQEEKLSSEKNTRNLVILFSGIFILSAILVILNINTKRKRIQHQNILIEEQRKNVERALLDLKSTQTQLIQREKLASLGELTAGIAHEIQNPLNFVNNFAELNGELSGELLEAVTKGIADEIRDLALNIKSNEEKILEHGKRADSIVKSMLQHSRTNTGQKEPVDINALCDEYLRLSFHGMRAKNKDFNVTMETDFDPQLEKINLVQQEIGRVLLNLFNNAFHAILEKSKNAGKDFEGLVSVSTRKLDGMVEVRVKDNGMGIPEEIKDKIFQPFFTTKPAGVGTGLGLSLSYDIMKAHQGEIIVDSDGRTYSTFAIHIPII